MFYFYVHSRFARLTLYLSRRRSFVLLFVLLVSAQTTSLQPKTRKRFWLDSLYTSRAQTSEERERERVRLSDITCGQPSATRYGYIDSRWKWIESLLYYDEFNERKKKMTREHKMKKRGKIKIERNAESVERRTRKRMMMMIYAAVNQLYQCSKRKSS